MVLDLVEHVSIDFKFGNLLRVINLKKPELGSVLNVSYTASFQPVRRLSDEHSAEVVQFLWRALYSQPFSTLVSHCKGRRNSINVSQIVLEGWHGCTQELSHNSARPPLSGGGVISLAWFFGLGSVFRICLISSDVKRACEEKRTWIERPVKRALQLSVMNHCI